MISSFAHVLCVGTAVSGHFRERFRGMSHKQLESLWCRSVFTDACTHSEATSKSVLGMYTRAGPCHAPVIAGPAGGGGRRR